MSATNSAPCSCINLPLSVNVEVSSLSAQGVIAHAPSFFSSAAKTSYFGFATKMLTLLSRIDTPEFADVVIDNDDENNGSGDILQLSKIPKVNSAGISIGWAKEKGGVTATTTTVMARRNNNGGGVKCPEEEGVQ
jgi:hypothetical protein